MTGLDLLVAHIRKTLIDSGELEVEEEAPYSSLPLCVVDAVYSMGVRYESTDRTVCDFRDWAKWQNEREHSISEFLNLLRRYEGHWAQLATEVFRNQQRTSPRSGILKAHAVHLFARALQKFGVDSLADLAKGELDRGLFAAIAAIPGQSSGISFKYFLMLAGHSELVKPDRMLTRFVANALRLPSVTPDAAEALIKAACRNLQKELPKLTPSRLDYAIWSYQRTRDSKEAPATRSNPRENKSADLSQSHEAAPKQSTLIRCWVTPQGRPAPEVSKPWSFMFAGLLIQLSKSRRPRLESKFAC